MSSEDAEQALERKGFVLASVALPHPGSATGTVLAQNPPAGERVPWQTMVVAVAS